MVKRSLLVLMIGLVLIVLSAGCSQQSTSSGGGGSSYFPHEDGYSWRYSYPGGGGQISTFEGTAVINSSGLPAGTGLAASSVTAQIFKTSVFNSSGTIINSYESYIRVTDSGVYSHGSPSYPTSEGLAMLDFPLEVGKTWTVYESGGEQLIASVAEEGSVTVPAGTFNCYQVSYAYKQGTSESYTFNYWYGDGAGMVKMGSNLSTEEVKLEWKSF